MPSIFEIMYCQTKNLIETATFLRLPDSDMIIRHSES